VAKPASTGRPSRHAKTARQAAVVAAVPTHRHPNMGLAPIDMTAGFPAAAGTLNRDRTAIAGAALEAAMAADPELRGRFDAPDLGRFRHDTEVLVERLAMCVASNDSRFLAEYAEWVGLYFRRQGVSQWDVVRVCEGIREVVGARLTAEESAVASRSLDAAIAVFQKNGRTGGDTHQRNALLKWLYRGV
jgi:hypothetical protein